LVITWICSSAVLGLTLGLSPSHHGNRKVYPNGGHRHMQDIRERVQTLGADVRLLDLYWKGIGET